MLESPRSAASTSHAAISRSAVSRGIRCTVHEFGEGADGLGLVTALRVWASCHRTSLRQRLTRTLSRMAKEGDLAISERRGALNERLRATGAEEDSRRSIGRRLTRDDLGRVLRRYPGGHPGSAAMSARLGIVALLLAMLAAGCGQLPSPLVVDRVWVVRVVNESQAPATLRIAEWLDERSAGPPLGRVNPDVVPAGATLAVTFGLPPGEGWWIFVNPESAPGPLVAPADLADTVELRIDQDGRLTGLSDPPD
jgi:hypothetical protein